MRDVLPKRTGHDTVRLVAPLGKDAPVPEASICYRQHAVVTQTNSSRRVLTSSPKVSHIPATPLSAQRIGLARWQADGTPSDKAPKALDETPLQQGSKGACSFESGGSSGSIGVQFAGTGCFCAASLRVWRLSPSFRGTALSSGRVLTTSPKVWRSALYGH